MNYVDPSGYIFDTIVIVPGDSKRMLEEGCKNSKVRKFFDSVVSSYWDWSYNREREQYELAVNGAQDTLELRGITPENTPEYYELVDQQAHIFFNAMNMAIGVSGGLKTVKNSKIKSINLPSWKKVNIDMGEVLSGHTVSGTRAIQSSMSGKGKDIFSNMTETQIEKAIRQAYRYGKKLETQGDRTFISGNYGGLTIQMWVNTITNTIETAWPK